MNPTQRQLSICSKRALIALLAIAFLIVTFIVQSTSKPVPMIGYIAMIENAYMDHDEMSRDMSPALCKMVCLGIGIADLGSHGEILNAFLPANTGIGNSLLDLSQNVDPSERPPQSA